MVQALSLCLLQLAGAQAWAQLDTSSVLLRPGASDGPTPQSLDGSRYKVRAPEPRKTPPPAPAPKPTADDPEDSGGADIPSPVPKAGRDDSAKVSTTTPVQNEVVTPSTAEAVAPPAPAPAPPAAPAAAPAPDLEPEPKESQDPRDNRFTLSLAPAYFYDGSASNYSFRNYHTDGPAFALGVNVWLNPFFGVQSEYFSSVSSSVRDSGTNVVPASTREFEAGIRFRRPFGDSRESAQITWGVDYREFSNNISGNALSAVGQKTSGLSFVFEGAVPQSASYTHQFGAAVRPFQHSSDNNASLNVLSGDKADSNAVSLSLGGQWTLDRRNQVYWKSELNVERNLYGGTANTADPKTGVAPSGVSVTNSLAIFYFGFRWGS